MSDVSAAFEATAVNLRAGSSGFVRSRVAALGDRSVVEIDARGATDERSGALAPADGQSMAAAARLARTQRLPLLLLGCDRARATVDDGGVGLCWRRVHARRHCLRSPG